MSSFLPLFPLQLVVFPGEDLNLHIFEPRYKQLIRECEETGMTFGIPPYINGEVKDIGTEIRLVSIEKVHQNGEMDIKTKGLGLFEINKFYNHAPERLYSGADVAPLEVNRSGDELLNEQIIENVKILFKLLNIRKPLPETLDFETYEIAHHVGFTIEQEYNFLCLRSEIERQNNMLRHLEKLIPVVRQMEQLQLKARMNGHFKNVIPPKF